VRQPQELVTKAELIHDPERRRVYRVAAEVSEEVGVFRKHYTVTPWRASSKPTITPAGPPPTMQHVFLSCSHLIAPILSAEVG